MVVQTLQRINFKKIFTNYWNLKLLIYEYQHFDVFQILTRLNNFLLETIHIFSFDCLLNQLTTLVKKEILKPIDSNIVVPRLSFKTQRLNVPLPLPILEFLLFLVKMWFGHKNIQIFLYLERLFHLPILPITPSILMFFNLKVLFFFFIFTLSINFFFLFNNFFKNFM